MRKTPLQASPGAEVIHGIRLRICPDTMDAVKWNIGWVNNRGLNEHSSAITATLMEMPRKLSLSSIYHHEH